MLRVNYLRPPDGPERYTFRGAHNCGPLFSVEIETRNGGGRQAFVIASESLQQRLQPGIVSDAEHAVRITWKFGENRQPVVCRCVVEILANFDRNLARQAADHTIGSLSGALGRGSDNPRRPQ